MQLGVKIFYGIFNTIIAIIGPISNVCLLYIIFSTKKHRKLISNTYLVTLAITDLLGSIVVAPYFLISLNLPKYDESLKEKYKEACKAGSFFVYSVGINRILALTLMSADRYLAILHPFVYQRIVNHRRVIAMNLFITFQAFVTNLPMSLMPGWVNYDGKPGAPCGFLWDGKLPYLVPYAMLNFGIPLVILLVSNISVFITARKQRRKILSMQVAQPIGRKVTVFGIRCSATNLEAFESAQSEGINPTPNNSCSVREKDSTKADNTPEITSVLCLNDAKQDKETEESSKMSSIVFNDTATCDIMVKNGDNQRLENFPLREVVLRNAKNERERIERLRTHTLNDNKDHTFKNCSISIGAQRADSRIFSIGTANPELSKVSCRNKDAMTTIWNKAGLHQDCATGNEVKSDREIVKTDVCFPFPKRNKPRRHENLTLRTHDIIITFSTIVLVVVFLISWSPFAFSRVAFVLDRRLFSWDAVVWTTALTVISCVCNPLIVLGTRRDLQRTIKDRFKVGSER